MQKGRCPPRRKRESRRPRSGCTWGSRPVQAVGDQLRGGGRCAGLGAAVPGSAWRLRESAAVPGSKRSSVVDQCDLEQVPDLSASVTLALKWGQ